MHHTRDGHRQACRRTDHPDATLENARREGVADRVTISTADMRQIPFPDGHFDVIVSKDAIHNVYRANERAAAVREIARVLSGPDIKEKFASIGVEPATWSPEQVTAAIKQDIARFGKLIKEAGIRAE